MKIKRLIATLLAGVLMMGNLSAVCLAAEGDPVPTNDTPAATETADDTDETTNALPEGFTLGKEVQLPPGVSFDENGNFTFDTEAWDAFFGDMETTGDSTGTGDADSAESDTAPTASEPVTEIITVGTVAVRSDTYLHLRTGPGMDQQIIGHLLRGAEVEIVGESGDWYEVIVPETTGYVHKNYLNVAEREITVIPPASTDGDLDTDADGDGSDALSFEGSMDDQTMMMLFLLMMSVMGNMNDTETSEPPSQALTPDGNLTLVDDYAENNEDGSGKQFITLTTKAGNVFYLVIDRDDKGEQNVHFMNLVDERDLLSLMEEDEAAEYTAPEPEVQQPTETENPAEGTEGEEPDPGTEDEKPASKINLAPVLILVLALAGGGGFFVYTKFFKGKGRKQQVKPDPDADYVEDDEDDYGLLEEVDVDDLPDEEENLFDADDDEPV